LAKASSDESGTPNSPSALPHTSVTPPCVVTPLLR
jgi:hypothetical protein